MKRVIFTIVFLCSIINVSIAQERGDNFLGLNFGKSKTTSESILDNDGRTTTSSSYNIGVNYAHFTKLNRKINIGFGVNFNEYNNNVNTQNQKANGLLFSLGYGLLFNIYEDFYIEV